MINIIEKLRSIRWSCEKQGPALALFTVYTAISLMVLLKADALANDERVFLDLVASRTFWQVFSEGAVVGYGQIYWITLKLVGSPFGARLVWTAMYLAIPLLILHAAKPQMRLPALLLWFAMPAAWLWNFKIVGPEIMSMFLAALFVWLLASQRPACAAFTLGLAIGVKVNAAPLAVLFLWGLSGRWSLSVLVRCGAAGLAGLVFANPIMIYDPARLLADIQGAAGLASPTLARLELILLRPRIEWDVVQSGGLAFFALGPFLLSLLFALGAWMRVPSTLLISAGLAVIALLVLCLVGRNYLAWYWAPIVPLLPMILARAERGRRLGTCQQQ